MPKNTPKPEPKELSPAALDLIAAGEAAVLDAMAGHEPGDSTSRVDRDTTSYDVPPLDSFRGLRVGVVENFGAVTTDPAVARRFEALLDTIADAGADIETMKLAGYEPHATRRAALVNPAIALRYE